MALVGRVGGWRGPEATALMPWSYAGVWACFPPPCPLVLGPGSRQARAALGARGVSSLGQEGPRSYPLSAFEALLFACSGPGGGARLTEPLGAGRPPCLSPPAAVPAAQGPVCVSAKLRLAERRQQRLQEVWAKREALREELAETQGRLMVEPGRWLEQCESPHSSPHTLGGAGAGPQALHPTCTPSPATSPHPRWGPRGWEGEKHFLGLAGTPA